MSNHVIIEFDPSAQYEWNRCAIRGLFSPGDIDLKQLIAQAINHRPGHYLARLSISVEVIEFCPIQEPEVLEAEAAFEQERFEQEQQDYLTSAAF